MDVRKAVLATVKSDNGDVPLTLSDYYRLIGDGRHVFNLAEIPIAKEILKEIVQ